MASQSHHIARRNARPRPAGAAPDGPTDPPARRIRDRSSVALLYLELRDRAMRYAFRPGERINEQALGRELGVSRSPLREALNRLASEGFLEFVLNKGFYRKALTIEEVFDLYQVRTALERRAVFLAVRVASDDEIAAVGNYWEDIMARAATMSVADLLLADEEFHRRLAALARNRELSAFLDQVARRVHMARHIDLEQSDWNERAFEAHRNLIRLIAQRQTDAALALMNAHMEMGLDRARAITREMATRFGQATD